MSGGWVTGFTLNALIGTAFLTIGTMLAVQLTRSKQWNANVVGSTFAVLVLACGAGHAFRAALGLGGAFGLFGATGTGMQLAFADWHMWIADALTALAGIFYVIARVRDRNILQTARVFEDYRSRRRRAIQVHDSVVQKLVEAKLALETDRQDEAQEALQSGLEASKAIVSRRGSTDLAGPDEIEDEPTEAPG